MMAPIAAPFVKIDGVTIYNPLPSPYFTDLDKECIIPIGISGKIDSTEIENLNKDIDDIVNSGVLPNGVHWGITSRNEDGFADILIDVSEVTEETIRQLIAAKVITVC